MFICFFYIYVIFYSWSYQRFLIMESLDTVKSADIWCIFKPLCYTYMVLQRGRKQNSLSRSICCKLMTYYFTKLSATVSFVIDQHTFLDVNLKVVMERNNLESSNMFPCLFPEKILKNYKYKSNKVVTAAFTQYLQFWP